MGSTMMDELEIKSLLVRERFYRDSCQWQKLRDSYHPDASRTRINISWFSGDVDGFVAGSEEMAQRGASASHTISPVEVVVKGDKASSLSTGSITVRFERDGVFYDCVSWTRFITRLEKTAAQGWKLLTLEAIYDRDSITPVVPGIASTNPFNLQGSRQSYRCLAWLLAQKGYVIDEKLPGLDRPESVAKLMDEQDQWLHD